MYQEYDTQPLPASETPAPAGEQATQHPAGPQRPKRRLAASAWICAAVIAVIVGAALLLPRPQAAPAGASPGDAARPKPAVAAPEASSSPPAAVEPSAPTGSAPQVRAPSAPAAQEQGAVAFTAFHPSGAAVLCADDTQVHPITLSWQSQNAMSAWFGIDTPNAQAAPLQEVSPSGSMTWDFFCSNRSTTYTVTIADVNGNLAHRSVVVERQ